ncbi:unnamed protein product, partial [Ectocarpus sp. 13 AM-2016]
MHRTQHQVSLLSRPSLLYFLASLMLRSCVVRCVVIPPVLLPAALSCDPPIQASTALQSKHDVPRKTEVFPDLLCACTIPKGSWESALRGTVRVVPATSLYSQFPCEQWPRMYCCTYVPLCMHSSIR